MDTHVCKQLPLYQSHLTEHIDCQIGEQFQQGSHYIPSLKQMWNKSQGWWYSCIQLTPTPLGTGQVWLVINSTPDCSKNIVALLSGACTLHPAAFFRHKPKFPSNENVTVPLVQDVKYFWCMQDATVELTYFGSSWTPNKVTIRDPLQKLNSSLLESVNK